jgi:sulfite dehydrogenase (cytochrome) subunit B
MRARRGAVIATLLLGLPLLAAAQTKSITLPPDHASAELAPGPGVETTRHACQGCHSTDYVVTQPRGDAKQWEGVVTKMMKVYGANITADDAKTIVQYLSRQYGK